MQEARHKGYWPQKYMSPCMWHSGAGETTETEIKPAGDQAGEFPTKENKGDPWDDGLSSLW